MQVKYFSILLLLVFNLRPETGYGQYVLRDVYPALSFTNLVEVAAVADGRNRLYAVTQGGQIYSLPSNPVAATESQVFLDISSRVLAGGERGLLGLAFHPDYQTNGYFYVNYTTGPPLTTRISRFSRDPANPAQADPASELVLLTYEQPFDNHNGGKLAFGPDGFLYIASGDGGSSGDPQNNAQNLTSLLGKILRIDVNNTSGNLPYGIPADNPLVGQTNGARAEIYAYGLRNPWRFSFDRETARVWAADVGQSQREEINIIQKGGNYGWRIMEGFGCYSPAQNCPTAGLALPVFEYNHNQGLGRSITGGYVYRGSRLPQLQGKYIYGDYVSGNIWALTINPDGSAGENTLLVTANFSVPAFGEDHDRELLVLSHGANGKIFTLSDLLTGVPERNSPGFTVYPNPARSAAVVRLEQGLVGPAATIKLFNMLGQEAAAASVPTGEKEARLELSRLPRGIYTLRVQTATADGWRRVVVE